VNYYVKRGEQQWGPYTLAALQQYVQQGNIARDDLARSEAMSEWVPVAQVLGNVSVSAPAFGAAFGTPGEAGAMTTYNPPPGIHWGVVLGVGILTVGIFWIIVLFLQAVWVRQVRPANKALFYLIIYVACSFGAGYFEGSGSPGIGLLLNLGGIVSYLSAVFGMRGDIEDYYNQEEPVGLDLNGVMTFFFNAAYFQYHLRRIKLQREAQLAGRAAATV
jgi:hypothetical protein